MYRLFLFLTIALGFVTQARAGGIDTLWTKPYDYLVGGYTVMAINHDSTIVAVGSENGYVKLYNINTGDSIACFHRKDSRAYSLSFSPDGEHFAYGFAGAEMTLINLRTMQIDTILKTAKCLEYNPKDSLIYLFDETENVFKIIDPDDYKEKMKLNFQDTVIHMFLPNDFSKIAFVELHRSQPAKFYSVISVYNTNTYQLIRKIYIVTNNNHDIRFSADAKEIAVACDGGIDFYNIDSGKVTRRFASGSQYFWSISYPNAGGYFATGARYPDHIHLVNNSTLEIVKNIDIPVAELSIPAYTPNALAFGKDNKKLLCAGYLLSCVDLSGFSAVEQLNPKASVVYPNPTTGNIAIDVENVNQAKEVKITNSKGIATPCEYTISDKQITIQTATLPAGVYFVQLFAGATQQTFKFVKE